MKHYLKLQLEKRRQLQEQYKQGNYKFEKPLIVMDPFEVAPLTAVVLWKSENFHNYCVRVNDRCYEVNSIGPHHEIHVVGLVPHKVNHVMIQAIHEGVVQTESSIEMRTEPLPIAYEALRVKTLIEDKKSKDYMALNLASTKGRAPRSNYCCILDEGGGVRWHYTQRGWNLFKQLRNNHVIMDAPTCIPGKVRYIPTGFVEMNFLGEVLKYYEVPNGLHHDVHELPSGNFLVLTDGDDSIEDCIVEIDRETGNIVKRYDMRTILDPNRVPGIDKEVVNAPQDWLHLNSVFYDELDDTLIVSSRNQNCVVKFERESQCIKWILGPHEHWDASFVKYLLEPIGEGFEWAWAQHSAFVTKEGQLMLFDNGNFRSYELSEARLAYANYSRGVAYHIDEVELTVHQVWEYGKQRGNSLKCPYLGSISLQNNGNRLICFGGITKDRFGNPIDDMMTPMLKASARLIEICQDTQEVVFELEIKDNDKKTEDGFVCYRAEAINLFATM